jgi:hypothetical protein
MKNIDGIEYVNDWLTRGADKSFINTEMIFWRVICGKNLIINR